MGTIQSSGCMPPFLWGKSPLWGQVGELLCLQWETERYKVVSLSPCLLARTHSISSSRLFLSIFSMIAPQCALWCPPRVEQYFLLFPSSDCPLSLLLKHPGLCLNSFLHLFSHLRATSFDVLSFYSNLDTHNGCC